MAHLDDEQLSLLALGEDLGKDAAVHVAQCRDCAKSLETLQYTVLVATTDPHSVQLQQPGSHNWAAIHAELELSPALAADPLNETTDAGTTASGAGTSISRDRQDDMSETGTSTPLRPSKKQPGARSGLWILGVAAGTAAGLVIGAWAAASILRPAEPPLTAPSTSASASTGPAAVVLAEAPLQPLASHSASGDAVVQRLADGSRQLVIRLPVESLPGFREVWLGSSDLSKMVSLGVLGNQDGAFVLPSGLDLAQYPIVDISHEPYDGDPAHSAESIARGALTEQG
jgi:hypothetical protein